MTSMPVSLSLSAFLVIGLGAAAGAWLRWLLSLWLNDWHPSLPVGTWVANLAGGLLIGLLLAWMVRHPQLDPLWRLFLVTGFLGALTTFSTFSAESLQLIQRGQFGWAIGHSMLHLFGCLLAAWIGYRIARA